MTWTVWSVYTRIKANQTYLVKKGIYDHPYDTGIVVELPNMNSSGIQSQSIQDIFD